MMRSLLIAACGVVLLAPVAWAGGPGGGQGGGTLPLSPAEIDGLLWMREEEKLARDVYQALGAAWEAPIFANIAASEQQHMDAVLTLLNRYQVADPAAGNDPGEFTNPDLQALYDTLVARGLTSCEEAFQVGVLIEQTDIADLDARLPDVTHADIRRVYTNLRAASVKHLAAFERQLTTLCAPGGASPMPSGPGPRGGAAVTTGRDGLGQGAAHRYRGERDCPNGGVCPNGGTCQGCGAGPRARCGR